MQSERQPPDTKTCCCCSSGFWHFPGVSVFSVPWGVERPVETPLVLRFPSADYQVAKLDEHTSVVLYQNRAILTLRNEALEKGAVRIEGGQNPS